MDFLKKILFVPVIIFAVILTGARTSSSFTDDDLLNAFKLSYKYEAAGQFGDAINALKPVYKSDNYEVNIRLGWLYYNNKQYNEAMQSYQNAFRIMPYSIEARLGYANSTAALQDWVKTGETYLDILNIDPNNSGVLYKLGLIYYYKPDYQKAFNCFEKVVNMYPFDYYSVLMLAWTNYQLGKGKEAEILFNKVLLISPDDASALEGLGLLRKN
jgi:tetratricopeptide (TPR) repeat protein